MASNSIYIYKFNSTKNFSVTDIYNILNEYPEQNMAYFNLDLLSENELLGEYVIIENIKESYYNIENRDFDTRITQKANIISFNIINNYLEIWANKTSAQKLIFLLRNLLDNISIELVIVNINDILNKIKNFKFKISKVCFDDFLFTKDIVGKFTVDLSSYGNAYSVLEKYKSNIFHLTLMIFYKKSNLKIRLTSKGTITIYKPINSLDNDELYILHHLLLDRGEING